MEGLGMGPIAILYDPDDSSTTEATKAIPVELFAMERRGGHNFYYVMLNDDEEAVLSSNDDEEREYTIDRAYEGDPESTVLFTSRDVINKGPEPTPDDEIQRSRVSDFVRWALEGEARLAALQTSESGLEGTAIDLRELAAADVWDYNASSDGQTFTIRYTIYSCHSFDKNKDYYLISQSAQLNPFRK